jgi:hypothetical protein
MFGYLIRRKKSRGPSSTGRGDDLGLLGLGSGADHLRHTTRVGRMMMVMVPNLCPV